MSNSVPAHSPSPRLSAWIVVAMMSMVALPAAITLNTIRRPAALAVPADPTPYGYTWSLLLFIIPIVAIAFWFLPCEGVKIPKKAFWLTLAILVPLGCGLDFFFARWFFLFPNRGATLGLGAPALGGSVPVEEYLFYLTGFMAVLMLYIWMDEYWLAAYNVPDYPGEAKKISRLLRFHPTSLVLGAALIVAAIGYKKFFAPSPRRVSGLFRVPCRRSPGSRSEFLPHRSTLHQLAGLQHHALLHPAHQSPVGGHSGRTLRLVGVPGESDAGRFRRSVVKTAHRGGLRLDSRYLHDYDCVRDRQALAGLGPKGQARVSGKPGITD